MNIERSNPLQYNKLTRARLGSSTRNLTQAARSEFIELNTHSVNEPRESTLSARVEAALALVAFVTMTVLFALGK